MTCTCCAIGNAGLAALSVLADHVPDGSRLALAGRAEPPLRVARLRAEGRILEIGPGDLSLTRDEAASLLRDAGITLGDDDLAELHRRTEGWPAGLYLAALYLREGGSLPGAAVSFGGDDRLVTEYMESEFLTRISRHERAFLTRAAVLDRMSGALCEAVLDLPRSAATLAELARSNLLLVPLDRQRTTDGTGTTRARPAGRTRSRGPPPAGSPPHALGRPFRRRCRR